MPPCTSTPSFGLRFRHVRRWNGPQEPLFAFGKPHRWERRDGSGTKVGKTQHCGSQGGHAKIHELFAQTDLGTQAQDGRTQDRDPQDHGTEALHQVLSARSLHGTIIAPLVAPGD
jgi:hypothetical protein